MVKLGCAGNLIKGFIFCFNIFCAASGVVLIIHGTISLLKVKELRSYLQNSHLEEATVVPTIVICFGVFVFIISFFGATGACQESRILIDAYAISMLTLVLMQIVLASLIFLFLEDINQESVRNFSKMWRSRNGFDNQMMIEMIQENLECCGLNSPSDYNYQNIPLSCCTKESRACTIENAFKIGCKTHLKDSIQTSGQTISLLCIATAIFELGAAILGFILSKQIRKCSAKRRCC
ncbi:tetraspanin-6-like [Chironomus tepperi]|uniref:tetraspanin-6-like n=1 Tax=Chironomus tepperi TaxID=113505 RepID=UPI00391FC77A